MCNCETCKNKETCTCETCVDCELCKVEPNHVCECDCCKEQFMIRKQGKQYVLMSKDGSRKLGTFPSRKQAEEREKQITRIKYAKGG